MQQGRLIHCLVQVCSRNIFKCYRWSRMASTTDTL